MSHELNGGEGRKGDDDNGDDDTCNDFFGAARLFEAFFAVAHPHALAHQHGFGLRGVGLGGGLLGGRVRAALIGRVVSLGTVNFSGGNLGLIGSV